MTWRSRSTCVADILRNSVFDRDELERERDVILQEIGRRYDTPDDLVFDLLQETPGPSKPLGRPILGTAEGGRGFDVAGDHFDYWQRHYSANHGGWRRPAQSSTPAGDGGRAFRLAVPQAGQRRMARTALSSAARRWPPGRSSRPHVALGLPGDQLSRSRRYASRVLSGVLGGGMSSDCSRTREERGLATRSFRCRLL